MKRRPLLSTAMRKSGFPDLTPEPVVTADGAAAPLPTPYLIAPGATGDQRPQHSARQHIDTLSGIYADAMTGTMLVAMQAWQQSLTVQLRLSAYMLNANQRVISGGAPKIE